MKGIRAFFGLVLLSAWSQGGPIVNFTIAPPGNPTVIPAGDSVFVVFSVFNSTPDPLFLYTSGLSISCVNLPCAGPQPLVFFNDSVAASVLGPSVGQGLQPGALFADVLYTVDFPAPTDVLLVPSVNFTSYTDTANTINGPTFEVLATPILTAPEPASALMVGMGVVLAGIGYMRGQKRVRAGARLCSFPGSGPADRK